METKVEIKLSQKEVFELLTLFDDSSDTPLHLGLDFNSYSEKLSKFAYFILAYDGTSQIGFIAYYLNEDGKFVYVPQVVVHKSGRHQGVGHAMFETLYSQYKGQYETIKLEVLKNNHNARNFYEREAFSVTEDHNERLLMQKQL